MSAHLLKMLSYIASLLPLDLYQLNTNVSLDTRASVSSFTLDLCCFLDLPNDTYKFLLNHPKTVITDNILLYSHINEYRYSLISNNHMFITYITLCVQQKMPICVPVINKYITDKHLFNEGIIRLHNIDVLNHCIAIFGYDTVLNAILRCDDLTAYLILPYRNYTSHIDLVISKRSSNIFSHLIQCVQYNIKNILCMLITCNSPISMVESFLLRTPRIKHLKYAAIILRLYPELVDLIKVKWYARNNYILRYLLRVGDIAALKLLLQQGRVVNNISITMRTYIERISLLHLDTTCLQLINLDKISRCWVNTTCYINVIVNDKIEFFPYLLYEPILVNICIYYNSYRLLNALATSQLLTPDNVTDILATHHIKSPALDDLLVSIINNYDCKDHLPTLARLCAILGLSKLPLLIPKEAWNNNHIRLCIMHNHMSQLEYIADICTPDPQTLQLAKLLSNKSAESILRNIQNASLYC